MKKLVFKYLDNKYPNQLKIVKDTSHLSSKVNPNEKYEAFYSGRLICALFIYQSGDTLHYTYSPLCQDLRSWFELSLHETDIIVFEWALNKNKFIEPHPLFQSKK